MYIFILIRTFLQVVVDANKLAKLIKERKSKENWLDYYQLKYSRNQSQRPMTKVPLHEYPFKHSTAFINYLEYFSHTISSRTFEFIYHDTIYQTCRLAFLVSGEKKWTQLIIRHLKSRDCRKK